MLTLIIFWLMFEIMQVLAYNSLLSQVGVIPNIILTGLYLVAWIVIICLGRRMHLGLGGYIGAGMVLFSVVFSIAVQIFPLQQILYDNTTDWNHVMLVTNAIGTVSALINLLGITLFLFSAKISLGLRLAVPGYFVGKIFLGQILAWIIGMLDISLPSYLAVIGVLMLIYVLAVLIPLYVMWYNRKSAALIRSTSSRL